MDFVIMYGVDICLILILAFSVIDYYRRGFVKAVLSLFAVVIALVLASQFSAPAAAWSYDNFFKNKIVEKVEEAIPEGFDSKTAAETVTAVVDTMPEYLVSQLKETGIDIDKIAEDINDKDLSKTSTAEQISEKIIKPGAVVLLRMILFILIFSVARGVLELIIDIINKAFKLPILKTANKWLGAGLGVLKGVIVVLLLCTVLSALSGVVADGKFKTALDNSKLTSSAEDIDVGEFNISDYFIQTK